MESQPRGWYRTHKLPHRDEAYLTQIITFRLHDSLPHDIVQTLAAELDINPKLTIAQRKKIEAYLDAGYGACYLNIPQIAHLMEEALRFYDGKWYELIAWVVMPNHVHVIIHAGEGVRLATILKAWKSYTAHESNKVLGRKGRFWQIGYFDRFIRDDTHYSNAIHYIHTNPVQAGLVSSPGQWQYSSARKWGLE